LFHIVLSLAMTPREDPVLALSTVLSAAMIVGLLALRLELHVPNSNYGVASAVPDGPRSNQVPTGESAAAIGWTDFEIAAAREQCMHGLQSIAADIEVLPPIKAAQCGSPDLVRLKSLGSNPTLVFDPPVDVNCRLMAALYHWTKETLQPEARKTFKTSVSRIVGASAYACRNVYGLATGNLSQHAFANAIDIGAFALSDGRMLTVLQGWGPTQRELQSVRTKALKKAPEVIRAQPAALVAKQRLAQVNLPSAKPLAKDPSPLAKASVTSETVTEAMTVTPATQFLRRVHMGACSAFATTLGPEANDEHRNHFHFDLNPARDRAHCH
jgi:hypothetical protein